MTGDGSIVIPVEVDDKKAQTELNRLARKIEGINDQIEGKTRKRSYLVEQAEKIQAAYKEAVSVQDNDEIIRNYANEYTKVQNAIKRIDDQIREHNIKIDIAKEKAGQYAAQLREAARIREEEARAAEEEARAASESEPVDEQEESWFTRIQGRIQEITEEIKGGFAEWGALAVKATVKVAGALAKVGSAALRAGRIAVSAFAKIGRHALSIGKSIAKTAASMNVFKRLSDKVLPSIKRIAGLAKRAFIFTTISAGFRYLKSQISLYLSTNDELTRALANLKGAFLTAFNPIFEAVIPALTALIETLTRVLASVASLTAMLFGKTAKQAKDNAEALNEQAQATKGAGKAAKEASKQLAAFDQLNILNDDTADGGGGGVETPEVSFDFEVDTKQWDSWGEALSEFMDKIILKLPDFSDALESFKEKINGFAVKIKDALIFDGLLDKVKTIGSTLGTTISNWFKGLDWKSLGTAFGAGLNILITLLDNFVNNVDWKGIGASIATFLNNAISEIDWEAVGRLFFAGVKIGILVLAGLIENADMEQVGQAITSFVQGFAQAVSETIEAVDWKKIGEQVRDLFCAIDWAAVAEAVFTVLGEAFAAAALFLWGLLEEAWNKVVQWWHEHAIEDGKFTLRGFLEGIGEAILGIANWIKEHVLDPFIKGFKKVFGIASPSKVMAEMGRYVIDGLKEGITSRISSVLEGIKKLFKAIKDWYETNVKPKLTVEYWKDQFSGISDGLKSVLNGILGFVETCINWIVDKLNGISIDVPSWAANILGISSIGFSIPRVSIPRLAQGAVIPPNREFMAVLGDQKHGTNIEAPLETIVAAFRQVMSEYGGGSFNFYLDGDPIYAKVERRRSQMARAGGR